MRVSLDLQLKDSDGSVAYPGVQEDTFAVSSFVETDYYGTYHVIAQAVAIAVALSQMFLHPLIVLIGMRKTPDNRSQYSIVLSEGYRSELSHWEFVVFVRKIAFGIVVNTFIYRPGETQYAIGLLLLLCVMALGLQTFYMPYISATFNTLEMLSLLGVIGVLFAYTMFLAADILGDMSIRALTACFLILPNLFYFLALGWYTSALLKKSAIIKSILRI